MRGPPPSSASAEVTLRRKPEIDEVEVEAADGGKQIHLPIRFVLKKICVWL